MRSMRKGDCTSFKQRCSCRARHALSASDKSIITAHLSTLRDHLADYFPEMVNVQWLVYPFHTEVFVLSNDSVDTENEFLQFRANTALKESFGSQALVTFWMETGLLFTHLLGSEHDASFSYHICM